MPSGIVRIGVMGCANIAKRSMIPAIKCLDNMFELVAIASRDYSTALVFAEEFNCEAVEGYAELLLREDIDAVYIPLPTGLHLEWIRKALEHGKHVYSEKSFALTYKDSEYLVNLAQSRGLALMEGYMFLYHHQQDKVRQLLNDGVVGKVRHFSGAFGFPPLPDDNFRYDASVGGGVLMDAAGYPLRAAYAILGDDITVKAATMFYDSCVGTEIWGSAFLSDNDGVGVSIAFGFDNFYQCRYEIWGVKGKISVDRAYTAGPGFSPSIVIERSEDRQVINIEPDNHFEKSMSEFYRVINNQSCHKKHYKQILIQSNGLEKIRELALLEKEK